MFVANTTECCQLETLKVVFTKGSFREVFQDFKDFLGLNLAQQEMKDF